MEKMIQELAEHPGEVERMAALDQLARLVMPLPLGLNLWKVQNTYWELLQRLPQQMRGQPDYNPATAEPWNKQFHELGRTLGFALQEVEPAEAAAQMAA
jgi:hypothetical protein